MTRHSKTLLVILIFIASGVCGLIVSIYQHRSNEITIIETYHSPAIFVKQLQNDHHAGEKIFQQFCSTCHAEQPFIDVNAPLIGDKTAWLPRRNMGEKLLLKLTIDGIAAMPARGGCFECSDEQLKQTIDYILRNSK